MNRTTSALSYQRQWFALHANFRCTLVHRSSQLMYGLQKYGPTHHHQAKDYVRDPLLSQLFWLDFSAIEMVLHGWHGHSEN